MPANFRSLIGGYYSSTPNDLSMKRSDRCNNPWALNDSAFQHSLPGYVGFTKADNSPNANRTAIYETPEQGVAAGWELLRRYATAGATTVGKIIARYGGSNQTAEYIEYSQKVQMWTGFTAETEIPLTGNDAKLLKFARAMFRYELGRESPLSDAQILYGFKIARERAGYPQAPAPVGRSIPPQDQPSGLSAFFAMIGKLLQALFGSKPKLKFERILRKGDTGPDVEALQKRLREIGYKDLNIDKDFGDVTEKAVRNFQTSSNLDPDGEVGTLTIDALNRVDATARQDAPLLPPSPTKYVIPEWYRMAESFIGFREVGTNRGIERFITSAHTGSLGDPWCAIFVNAMLEDSHIQGSRSAMARSFETNPNFKRIGPAVGAIVTMWRGSPSSGSGHVFFYDGESANGVRGIGANEDDQVKRSFHQRDRITGYWWPKSVPTPKIGEVRVNDTGGSAGSEV